MSENGSHVPSHSKELVIFTVGIVSFAALVSLLCMCSKNKRNVQAQQEQNVYSISGRVPSNTTQYPDAYLSVEHISVTNELNKPPKYDDAPPSYEEAIKLAMAQSNSLQTLQVEQARTHRDQSSTSGSTGVAVPVHVTSSRTTD